MRLKPFRATKLSKGFVATLTLVGACAGVLGMAGPSAAAVAATTVFNPSPDVFQKTTAEGSEPSPPTVSWKVQVDAPVADNNVRFKVTSGPDGPTGGLLGAAGASGACVVTGTFNGLVADVGHPVCSYKQTQASMQGAGKDTVVIYLDSNGNGSQDPTESALTVHATWVGTPASIAINGPTSISSLTCTAFSTSSADGNGAPEPHNTLSLRILQPSNAAHPDPTALKFCGALPNITFTSPKEIRATINTGMNGEPVGFAIQTDGLNPLTIQSFIDSNQNGVPDPASGLFGTAELVTSKSVSVTVGGADGVKKVVVSLPTTSVFKGETVNGNIILTDVNGAGISNVTPVIKVSGVNSGSINASPSDGSGKAAFTYTPTAAGTDTITSWVDQSGGLTGVHDPNEPQGSLVVSVSAVPQDVALGLTVHGTVAGGKVAQDAGTSGTGDAQHGVVPTTQSTDTFTAHVTDSAAAGHPARQGVSVRFSIPASNGRVSGGTSGGTSANNASLSSASVVTDANGDAVVTLTDPAPVSGDGFQVVASIGGTATSVSAWLLFEAPTVAPVPDPTGNALNTTFPTAQGTIAVSPAVVTTQVGTNQTFTATVKDQFGNLRSGVTTIFHVLSGRNVSSSAQSKTTDASGKSSATFADTSTAPLSAGKKDVIEVVADKDGDITTTSDQIAQTADRFYTAGAPIASAVNGGVGAPTEQFSSTPPYAPVTSDDSANAAIDAINAPTSQTPTKIFFEARNSDNSSQLPGRTISLETSGAGSLVTGANNAQVSGPLVLTIGSDGFVRANVLSIQTGDQIVTATIDNVTATVTIHWTNVGLQRVVSLAPSNTTAAQGSQVTLITTATDAYGNKVPSAPVTLTLAGPGSFTDGSTTLSSATGSDGTLSVKVKGANPGTITATVTMSGSEINKPANTPVTGSPAGSSSASATITVTNQAPGDAGKTTLTFSPGTSVAVGSVVTVTGTVRDSNGSTLAGKAVNFTVSGVTNSTTNLTTDNNGQASIPVGASTDGTAQVVLKVLDKTGATEFTKSGTITFGTGGTFPRPRLAQQSSNGTVLLTFVVDSHYVGKTVYFFRKSGITGKVVPLGTGQVNSGGYAFREFNTKPGGILALYGKILGAQDIEDPYSNTVAFKVQ